MPPPMIGGYVTGPVLAARSAGVVVAVRQVLAFPAGVEIEMEAHARGTAHTAIWRGGELPVVFRVRFADGREAALDDEAGLRSGRGPMLVASRVESGSGGPDDGGDLRLTLWLWPLPPPGPVTVTCAWADRGLHEASLVLDGDAVRAAAGQAQPFWPPSGH